MAFNVSHKQAIAYFNNKLISEWLPGLYWHILITAYIVKNIRTAFETPTAAPYRLLEHSSPLPTEQFHTVSHTSGKRCKICRPDSGSESSDVRWNNLTLYPQNPIGRVRVPSRGGAGGATETNWLFCCRGYTTIRPPRSLNPSGHYFSFHSYLRTLKPLRWPTAQPLLSVTIVS